MIVQLDRTKCDGFGACADACPSVFEIDEFGFAQLLTNEVPAGEEENAREAAKGCPKMAIAFDE